jgi:hypothetical protein
MLKRCTVIQHSIIAIKGFKVGYHLCITMEDNEITKHPHNLTMTMEIYQVKLGFISFPLNPSHNHIHPTQLTVTHAHLYSGYCQLSYLLPYPHDANPPTNPSFVTSSPVWCQQKKIISTSPNLTVNITISTISSLYQMVGKQALSFPLALNTGSLKHLSSYNY